MSIKLLNPEDIENMIQKRKEQYEQIKDFVDNNPYPEPDEMGRILQTIIEKGFPAKPIRRLDYIIKTFLKRYITICLMKIKLWNVVKR